MKFLFLILVIILSPIAFLYASDYDIAEITVSPLEISAVTGQKVNVNIGVGKVINPDNIIIEWGDGTHEDGFIPIPNKIETMSHVYEKDGYYTIRITAVSTAGTLGERTIYASIGALPAPPPDVPQKGDVNPLSCKTFGECFNVIANVLFWLSIGIVCFCFVVAGIIMFFTSVTPDKVILAKKVVLWSLAFFGIMAIVKIIASVTKGDLTNLENLPEDTK